MKLAFLTQVAATLLTARAAVTPFDSPDYCSQIITPTCNTTFSYIDALNSEVRPLIVDLAQSPFFRYFKLDLDKQCKFWDAQHFCATRNCAVETLPEDQYDWSHVPDNHKPAKLGEIQRDSKKPDGSETCEDLDYCQFDDDHNCVFVDLLSNPERFTGYGGAQSLEVWQAIYSENCFPNTSPMSMAIDSEPEQCVEKNLFYRLISGMHASIAVHLSNEYLDPDTEEFGPNLQVFMERVGKFNDRLANIYFNYALVSQALVKLSELVAVPDYISGNAESKAQTGLLDNDSDEIFQYSDRLDKLTSKLSSETLFETHSLFDPAVVDPNLKNEFRARFKNVSAIMDCVGCDRCRMWGKLQTIGYGTALKILFDSEDPTTKHLMKVRRIELVALYNTFDRLSKSVASINNFKELYLAHLEDVAAGRAKHGNYEPPHDSGIEFPFVAFSKKANRAGADKPKKDESEGEGEIKSVRKHKQGMKEELESVIDALRFVCNSYVEFPRTMYNLALYYATGWWNVYIGKAVYVPKSSLNSLDDEL